MPCSGRGGTNIPRNGSGVYSLPNTYEAVSGETIEAQQHNDPLEDLQQDANAARPIVAGGTGGTTAQEALTALFAGGKTIDDDELLIVDPADPTKRSRIDAGNVTAGETWPIFTGKGADVASASTVALGAGNFFHITGTTTITDIDFTDAYNGRWAILEFDGILTLTHNATTLVLPGGASITTAAGDTCMIVQDSSDNVHVVAYQRIAAPPPIITPFVAYTPTFVGFGTPTDVNIKSRREGNCLRIIGRFTAGTVSGVTTTLTLGFNGTNANVTSSSTIFGIEMAGPVAVSFASASSWYALRQPSVGVIYFGVQNASSAALNVVGSSGFSNSQAVSFDALVPIAGW